MVALLADAFSAIASMLTASGPRSSISSEAAPRMACRAFSLRGRPRCEGVDTSAAYRIETHGFGRASTTGGHRGDQVSRTGRAGARDYPAAELQIGRAHV